MSNEPLSEVMRIRLTPGQHRRLSEAAALSGLNLSDYVRRRLTAADTLAEELDALRQAVRHLSQISETHAAALETAFLVRATARPEQIAIAQAASHWHTDHIGAASVYGPDVEIVAHEITKELLERFPDPGRPLPTVTFAKDYTLTVGGVTLELSYKGENHCPGNIFIYAPAQKVLTCIDIISPGSATFMHCDASQNITAWYEAQHQIMEYDFDFLVAGHHMKYGTPDLVKESIEYFADILEGAQAAIDIYSRSDRLMDIILKPGLDRFWVGSENWINSMVNYATKHVLEKKTSNGKLWSERLAGVTTQTKYHAYTVMESIRLERPRPNYRLRGENPPPFLA
ncbi:hypothetical protein PT7_0906 [Pusillimonas sp. T7-7]|uniref:plasmid mobilization protein n=1 Tax=Pusillimonas sp. (strain T7-7) TaxID=1007105 RepID=UPI0002084D9D|nr:MBL fold metallo-hydrolase [Pusillimonas sp. T7-7]AEC19446.1 hypothetical protein PT7_0906 [Pusillimonas sp. T7-7]